MVEYPHIALVSIYLLDEPERTYFYRKLYELLQEREPDESISHRSMPTWEDHCLFIEEYLYREWYMIVAKDQTVVGSLYLTKQNEIGISIFKDHRHKKYASAAIYNILEFYPDEIFIANINPANQKSIDLFTGFGFQYVQNTYKREPVVLKSRHASLDGSVALYD